MTTDTGSGRERDWLPYVELVLALAAAALWYSTGGAMWFRDNLIGLWPVVLVLALWPLHWASRGRAGHAAHSNATYAVWLGVFLLSAGLSVWAAYDREIALAKLGLILGGVGLAAALAHQPTRRHLYVALAVLSMMAAALGVFFVLTNDWAAQPLKVPFILRLGEALSSALPELPGHRISPNVAGGMLVALLPMAAALFFLGPSSWLGLRPGRWIWVVRAAWGVSVLVALLALFLSVSRGAWMSLAAAAFLWAAWLWIARTPAREPRRWRRQLFAMGGLCVGVGGAALLAGYLVYALGLPGAGALAGRFGLWRDGLYLAQDYAYTGVGLGLFMIPFSVYSLLIHVGYTVYSHNMWIDILTEQGVLGLTAMVVLVGAAVADFGRWRRQADAEVGLLMEACLASIVAVAVHGLVDSVLYGSRGVLILFVPFGVMMACTQIARREAAEDAVVQSQARGVWGWVAPLAVLAATLLGATVGRPVAAWHANLGAVAQTQAELQLYDPERFHDPDLDQVRRQVDLTRAQTHLWRAASSPGHPTAYRRLTAIALAQGEYVQALSLMQRAWDAGHRDAPTRLLYGDALIANGHVHEGVQVIAGLKWAIPRMDGQAWSRYWAPGDYERAAYAYQAVSLLQPERADAHERSAEARRRAGLPPLEP